MSTRLTHELTYDAAPEQVSAMLDDPAFREDVCRRQRSVRQQVAIDGPDVRIEFTQRTQGLPGFAAKIVGDEVTVVQTEAWSSTTEADVRLEIPGKPADVAGTVTLEATPTGTVERVELDIAVRVPIVGGRLEGLLKTMFRDALERENEVGREYLGG